MSRAEGEPRIPEDFSFEDITWTGFTVLRDQKDLERNLDFMRILLEKGTPSDIIENSYANNVPKAYEVDGVYVEFLPHWGFYKAGNISLGIPESAETFAQDIAAAQYIASRLP